MRTGKVQFLFGEGGNGKVTQMRQRTLLKYAVGGRSGEDALDSIVIAQVKGTHSGDHAPASPGSCNTGQKRAQDLVGLSEPGRIKGVDDQEGRLITRPIFQSIHDVLDGEFRAVRFFGREEDHIAPFGKECSDDVGEGHRFSGAWWAGHHQRPIFSGGTDGIDAAARDFHARSPCDDVCGGCEQVQRMPGMPTQAIDHRPRMGPTRGESASPLFGKGRQALVGDISADETERVEGGGARRVAVIGVIFRPVGEVADALDHQPRDQRMSAHHQAEGRPFHVDGHGAAHGSPHLLERLVGPHGAAGGHRLDMAGELAPRALFRRGRRTFQARDEGLPRVE